MDAMKVWIAENTNPECVKGALAEGLRGADVFLGLSGPGILKVEELELMAKDPIMFALANPVPEIWPEAVAGKVRVIATGRSDYPNQINNVLCFPGMFRGALDVRARTINEEMELAAAHAIAGVVRPEELGEEYIIPSVFDRKVALAVAEAVAHTARETGVAQAHRRPALHPHSEHK
jgi:malate dehydrogenase (oxaloacetate-decarboxylating)